MDARIKQSRGGGGEGDQLHHASDRSGSAASFRSTLSSIRRREINDPFRALIQELVASRVEKDPEAHLAAYARFEQSFGGRYISADLFKEVFPEYSHSSAARNQFNTCVHNAAAVLSAMQLTKVLATPPRPGRNTVMLLTGIPGAGKTSAILSMQESDLPLGLHAIFEGQLSNPETTRQKIDEILYAGYEPLIVAVHTLPEQALRNTLQRYAEIGRGAGIGVMAEIQAGLPASLAQVADDYGDKVSLEIIDRRSWTETKSLSGWSNLEVLRSEGSHEQIKKRLANELERARSAGGVTDDCYRQALGRAPRGVGEWLLVDQVVGQHHQDGHRSCLPANGIQEAVLTYPAPLPFPIYLQGERCAVSLPDAARGHYIGPVVWADGATTALQSVGRTRTLVMHDTRSWARQPMPGASHEILYGHGLAVSLSEIGSRDAEIIR